LLYIYPDEYPAIRINKKKYKLHRIIYEAYYRCRLLRWTIIHHKNHNKLDSTIDNLEPVIGRGKHRSLHRKPEILLRRCLSCLRDWSKPNMKGTPNWFKRGAGYICNRCYHRDWIGKNRERSREQARIHTRNRRLRLKKEGSYVK